MKNEPKIYIAGHRGLAGSAIRRTLLARGVSEDQLLLRTHAELDLTQQNAVRAFFEKERPTQVYMAAAKVGGILANSRYPVEFLYDNTMIEMNVIRAAADFGVEKFLFLGSSCIYPREAAQPIRETSLLTGALEQTNEGYALSKITGLKLCEYYARQYGRRFISAMPTNLYGPEDNFHPENSHVIPGMMRRIHEAKVRGDTSVEIWGTGQPKREFLYIDDLGDALVELMDRYDRTDLINVGTGQDCTIAELAVALKEIVGFKGELRFNPEKPDGTPRKILDVSKIHEFGWKHRVSLQEGLKRTYDWAIKNRSF